MHTHAHFTHCGEMEHQSDICNGQAAVASNNFREGRGSVLHFVEEAGLQEGGGEKIDGVANLHHALQLKVLFAQSVSSSSLHISFSFLIGIY